ncbi:MAG: FAD-dependent oxidoreductase [Microbacterium sp.]
MDAVTAPAEPLGDLAATAHGRRIAIVGAGIAGLVAALECAKVGLQVTVIEEAETLGGAIRLAEISGVTLDVGADGWSTAGGHVRGLVDELGLADAVTPETPRGAWVTGIPSGAAPLPAGTLLGIPANPWDPAVRRVIGWRGVWRAYLDRLRPPLTIGQERNLDKLVRGRMGDLVADLLVAPLSVGRHGLAPAEVDVDLAAPGLSTALTRTGSLSGAVAQLSGDAAPTYETLEGGMGLLVEALRSRLEVLGADVIAGSRVRGLVAVPGARPTWEVLHGRDPDAADERVVADDVIVAVPEREARRLLAAHVEGLEVEPRSESTLEIVTLLVHAPGLDDHPRGSAVYPVPGTHTTSAVVHTSARWPWLSDRLGPGRHVVRIVLRGEGSAGRTPRAADQQLIALAEAEASALLGVPLTVEGARVDRFAAAPPRAALGQVTMAQAVRTAVRSTPGLAVTGAWISGSGLAQVVPDAVTEAERVRRRALWGSAAIE